MKIPKLLLVSAIASALTLAASAAESGFKSLFNGKDLTGWEGLSDFWSVRDGAIAGVTTKEHQPAANTFLVWKGEVKNFELRARFRLTGQNESGWGNSGVQYRSHVIDPATFIVGGYQADIDTTGQYAGMLYEERGRGILMKPGQKIRILTASATADTEPKADKKAKQKAPVETVATVTTAEQLAAAYKKGDWNEITIIANGNHLQHFLNGTLTADVTDTDLEKGAKSGVLALQLHKGQAMTIEFKDIRLKTLP